MALGAINAELGGNPLIQKKILFAVPNFKIQAPDELVSGPITMTTSSAVLSTKINRRLYCRV
jgi:hypothetical protein